MENDQSVAMIMIRSGLNFFLEFRVMVAMSGVVPTTQSAETRISSDHTE